MNRRTRDAMGKLVSVVIPVYNVQNYIKKCLDSVLAQSYKNLELILVDDGSKDDSGSICDTYALKDDRIKVIHKKNGGLSDARNVGIEQAGGEYITFIDSDDFVAENMIELLYKSMEEHQADVAIGDALHVFDSAECSFSSVEKCREYTPEEAIEEMWYQTGFLPSAWGKLYKRKLFSNLKFKVGIIFEDIDIMHEIFYAANKIVYNSSQLYAYVHRENSITTHKFSQRDLEIQNICDRILEFSKDKSEDMQKAALAYCMVGNLRVFLNAPNQPEFQEAVQKAKILLNQNARKVTANKKIRKKLRYGLYLYLYFRPVIRFVYVKINRWE